MSSSVGSSHKLLRLLKERDGVLILDGGLATALESEVTSERFCSDRSIEIIEIVQYKTHTHTHNTGEKRLG